MRIVSGCVCVLVWVCGGGYKFVRGFGFRLLVSRLDLSSWVVFRWWEFVWFGWCFAFALWF